MWNTLFRTFSGDEQAHGYFPTVARYGANMTPEDMYHGTRLAAAEALNAGMTTVHDWCHNIRSREFAERARVFLTDGRKGRMTRTLSETDGAWPIRSVSVIVRAARRAYLVHDNR